MATTATQGTTGQEQAQNNTDWKTMLMIAQVLGSKSPLQALGFALGMYGGDYFRRGQKNRDEDNKSGFHQGQQGDATDTATADATSAYVPRDNGLSGALNPNVSNFFPLNQSEVPEYNRINPDEDSLAVQRAKQAAYQNQQAQNANAAGLGNLLLGSGIDFLNAKYGGGNNGYTFNPNDYLITNFLGRLG